jgi:hypothetical protein
VNHYSQILTLDFKRIGGNWTSYPIDVLKLQMLMEVTCLFGFPVTKE